MKKQTTIQKMTKSKLGSIIGKSLPGTYKTTIQLQHETGKSNTFLFQNIGKDPPGRSRIPGAAYSLEPDNLPATLKNNNNLLITEFQMLKQLQNPNFLTINFLQL